MQSLHVAAQFGPEQATGPQQTVANDGTWFGHVLSASPIDPPSLYTTSGTASHAQSVSAEKIAARRIKRRLAT